MSSIHTCPQLSQALLGCVLHQDPFSNCSGFPVRMVTCLQFHRHGQGFSHLSQHWPLRLSDPLTASLSAASVWLTSFPLRQLQQLLSPSSLCPHTLHHPLCHVYKTVPRLVQGFLLLSWQTPKDQASAITSSRCASWVAHPLLHALPCRLASASQHRASWSHLVSPLVAAPAHPVLLLSTEGRCN